MKLFLQVRLQTQPIANPVYKGLTDCFVKTMKWEGIGGLYKGVGKGQMLLRCVISSLKACHWWDSIEIFFPNSLTHPTLGLISRVPGSRSRACPTDEKSYVKIICCTSPPPPRVSGNLLRTLDLPWTLNCNAHHTLSHFRISTGWANVFQGNTLYIVLSGINFSENS